MQVSRKVFDNLSRVDLADANPRQIASLGTGDSDRSGQEMWAGAARPLGENRAMVGEHDKPAGRVGRSDGSPESVSIVTVSPEFIVRTGGSEPSQKPQRTLLGVACR
jgi:hypothetical protein